MSDALDQTPTKYLTQVFVIPHKRQRYDTVGDWIPKGDFGLDIWISDLGDWRMEKLVEIHENVEASICMHKGIAEETVARYDRAYEAARPSGESNMDEYCEARKVLQAFGCSCPISETSEPGDDKHAPYHMAHQMATAVERIMAASLDVPWMDYEKRVLACDY